jgi:hypothetical protein
VGVEKSFADAESLLTDAVSKLTSQSTDAVSVLTASMAASRAGEMVVYEVAKQQRQN